MDWGHWLFFQLFATTSICSNSTLQAVLEVSMYSLSFQDFWSIVFSFQTFSKTNSALPCFTKEESEDFFLPCSLFSSLFWSYVYLYFTKKKGINNWFRKSNTLCWALSTSAFTVWLTKTTTVIGATYRRLGLCCTFGRSQSRNSFTCSHLCFWNCYRRDWRTNAFCWSLFSFTVW